MMGARINHDKTLEYMVDLAEGRMPVSERKYRVDVSEWNATDETIEAINRCSPYPVWLLDPIEAEKMLFRQYVMARDDNLQPHPTVETYVMARLRRLADGETPGEIFLRRPRGSTKDRDKEFETEKMRAEVEVERHRIKEQGSLLGDDAIAVIADRHGLPKDTLDKRLYPRKK